MTTTDAAFRIPDDVRDLLPTKLIAIHLPADPSNTQIIAAWDARNELDAEAGAWLRAAVREPESAAFYIESAQQIAVVSQALTEAVGAADAAVKLKS